MYLERFENLEATRFESPEGNTLIQCAPFSTIIDSNIVGAFSLEKYSCVNRSTCASYVGIGLQSYISDCQVGKYTLIGSRVSVGGFEHPTDWLSIGAFQWGQSVDYWGLSPSLRNHLDSLEKPVPELTEIGPDCWVGNNAVILSGVKISTGVIVGAGSVVTKDLPPYSIVVGNPARIIKYRFDESVIEMLLKSKWWERDIEDLKGLDFKNIHSAMEILNQDQKL